ncbi:MAG: DivIVA domain-containing protein [Defluviitaleaceae bacterium]|nr:DivIVA domain-containing protein [Defluviitaleaceae bacterium]
MSERFVLVKRGYDTEAVDYYVTALETQIDNYREKDRAINNAIVSAQQAADSIILNAKNQGRIIRENTVKQLTDIALSVGTQKQLLEDFVNEYNNVVSKYLKLTDNEDFKVIAEKINALESYLSDFSDEVVEDLEIESRVVVPSSPSSDEV